MSTDRDSTGKITSEVDQKLQGKLGQYEFKGQHAFKGGLASCVSNVTEAISVFSHMTDEKFFENWPPPKELTEAQKKKSSDALSNIIKAGNQLSLESNSIIAADKTKGEIKVGVKANPLKAFFKRLVGKEFKRFLTKIGTSTKGHENIKDLFIMSENDSCRKDELQKFCEHTYKDLGNLGLQKKNILFVSTAALHGTCLFAKTRPSDGKTFFYLFDSSPARAIGGSNKMGTLEVHDSLNSVVDALKSRWKVFYRDDQEGVLYVVTTQTRINELLHVGPSLRNPIEEKTPTPEPSSILTSTTETIPAPESSTTTSTRETNPTPEPQLTSTPAVTSQTGTPSVTTPDSDSDPSHVVIHLSSMKK